MAAAMKAMKAMKEMKAIKKTIKALKAMKKAMKREFAIGLEGVVGFTVLVTLASTIRGIKAAIVEMTGIRPRLQWVLRHGPTALVDGKTLAFYGIVDDVQLHYCRAAEVGR